MGYRTVLVGTDGSETATVAVRHAAGIAASTGARVVLVTAYGPTPPPADTEEVPEDIRWMITDAAGAEEKVAAAKAVMREAGVGDIRTRVGSGDPAKILIDAADDVGADLIVVGSKGMTSKVRFVLGSVPNTVSHHAPCDVLIVHTA